MSSRRIAALLLLTLGLGVPAQAKPPAAGAVFPRQGGVLEELMTYGATLFLVLKDGGGLCGTGYCPTPPPPPPPGHTMSIMVFKPRPVRKGSLP
jgi:hypothetical protein